MLILQVRKLLERIKHQNSFYLKWFMEQTLFFGEN